MYILLLISLLVILFITFILFNKEVFCPPVILITIFFACALFGITRYSDWQLENYSIKTIGLIILGLSSFVLFSFLAYKSSTGNNNLHYAKMVFERDRIDLGMNIVVIMLGIGIIADVMFIIYIRNLVASYGMGGGGFTSFVLSYYQLKTWHSDVTGVTGVTKMFSIVANINAVIAVYILLHNNILKKNKKKDIFLIGVVGLWILHCLLDSSRGEIMLLLAEAAYIIYFMWSIYYGWNDAINKKIIKWGIKAFVILIVVFVILTFALGRRESIREFEVLKYLSVYMSGGVRNFDLFVKKNVTLNDIFGKETFYSINRFLNNRFGIGEYYNNALEYTEISGVSNGNIYTALRRFYADFGTGGLIVLPGVLGYFYTRLFRKIKYESQHGIISFRMLLFSFLCSELFFFPIEERFFTSDFSVIGIARIIILYILYRFMIKKDIKIKFGDKVLF